MNSHTHSRPACSSLRIPRLLAPALRGVYHAHFLLGRVLRWIYRCFYAGPLFRSRCDSTGANFDLMKLPDIAGHSHIHIGRDVSLRGHFAIASGRIFDHPVVAIGDGVELGDDVVTVVNKELVLEPGAKIGAGCRMMDTDAHPRDAALRAANAPPAPEEIKPVHIGRNAAVGRGSFILKGVTIGEGAAIGINSVVVADVPPYATAAGNPARVVARSAPQQQRQ